MWDLLKAIIPYIGAFLSGSAVTLYGQSWITFRFKRLEELHIKRVGLVEKWKIDLVPYFAMNQYGHIRFLTDYMQFRDELSFVSLEPHISQDLRMDISRWQYSNDVEKVESLRTMFRAEIARIESDWKLI